MSRMLGTTLAALVIMSAPARSATLRLADTQLQPPVVQVPQDVPKIRLDLPGSAGDAPSTHPVVPCLMSLVLPGLGQFYNGQPGKGVGFLVGSLGLTGAGLLLAFAGALSASSLGGRQQNEGMALGGVGVGAILAGTGLRIWSMTDAWQVARGR